MIGLRVILKRLGGLVRHKKFRDSCRAVQEFTDKRIMKALNRNKATKSAHERKRIYLVDEFSDDTNDVETVRNQLLNIFFAARDTISIALGHAFFFIARRPEVWDHLREEVKDLTLEDLTFERLRSLKYVQSVLKEGMSPFKPFYLENLVFNSWIY
jgi:cytochrome P450